MKVGSASNGDVEILEGIKEGDRIVLKGAGFLGEGGIVRIVQPEKAVP